MHKIQRKKTRAPWQQEHVHVNLKQKKMYNFADSTNFKIK